MGPAGNGSNTALGHKALFKDADGEGNTAVGALSGYETNAGQYNTSVGFASFGKNVKGGFNTAIGYAAGDYETDGSYNTFLGAGSGWYGNPHYSYSTALGFESYFTASNQIALGRTTEGVFILGPYLKIGGTYNKTLSYALDVTGNGFFSGTLTSNGTVLSSDYRIKENVTPLDNVFTVDNLNPVTYTNTKTLKQDIGLIAPELQEHYPFLVNGTKDGEELQSVNYIGLIGILIKEIQILKAEIVRLDAKDNTVYDNLVAYINSKFTA